MSGKLEGWSHVVEKVPNELEGLAPLGGREAFR